MKTKNTPAFPAENVLWLVEGGDLKTELIK